MTHPITSISVITPSYRQLDLLKLCAASVADQPGHVEHIIQDGGSGADFESWASGQDFAQCHMEADTGMYDAINRGFSKAHGDILCWLNCDEQYLPGALAKVAGFFQTHPDTDILFGDVILTNHELVPVSYRMAVKPLATQIRLNFLPTYSAATFIRRRIIDEGHLLDDSFRAIADAEWIHRLLSLGYRVDVLNEPLSLFMQTGENLGQSTAGREESRRWRAPRNAWDRLSARMIRIRHQWHKLAAGAYRRRHVETAVHHPKHSSRIPMKASIGGLWREK